MALYKPRGRRWIEAALFMLAGVTALAPQVALAQQARPGVIPHPAAGYYARLLPARPEGRVVSQPMLVEPTMGRPTPQRPFIFHDSRVTPQPRPTIFAPRSFGGPRTFSYGSDWQGIGPRGYFSPFWFGDPYFFGAGYFGPSNYQMLPLGFGLWPACDSGSIPGRFWTVGPCAGIGDYAAVTPSGKKYLLGNTPSPWYFQMPPELFIPAPQSPASAAKKPVPIEKQPNMVVYLTNGRAVPVSDWWVTEGRFYFNTVSGHTETVDLSTLDLQRTIVENEKQGLTFILNFTPPNERPVLPALPSQP